MSESRWDNLKDTFYMYNHRGSTFLVPVIITVVVSVALILLHDVFRYHDLWSPLAPAVGNATHFCELNRFGELVVQPSNTWSNLAYLLVGVTCISIGIRDHKYEGRYEVSNLLAQRPGFSILLGASAVILFIGSFLYHASLTWFFQKLDQNGIYFVIISMFSYNFYKIKPTFNWRGEERSTHIYFIVGAIAMMVLFFTVLWKVNIMYLFPSLIISFFALNIINNKLFKATRKPYTKVLNAGAISLLLASFVWIMDWTDVWCIPTSLFQGHALWHILTALAILIIYFYYRGEQFLGLDFSENDQEHA
jgi:hypothetical protein